MASRHHAFSAYVVALAAIFVSSIFFATMRSVSARPVIEIKSCQVLQAVRTHAFWFPWGPITHAAPYADGIHIVYVNHGAVPAERVAFSVNYRGDVQHIVDVGTFSPGATIDHTFGNFSGDAYLGPNPNSCVARAARFVNGTVWRAGGH